MILAFVMIPFVSFVSGDKPASAKTVVSDSDLGALTAQSGVSIDFSGLSVQNVSQSISSWGDSDGFAGYTGAGWVGAAMSLTGTVVGLSGTMNIDVGSSGNNTRLKIDLPTITIGGTAGLNQDQTVKLSTVKTLNAAGFGELGQSFTAGLKATVSGSVQLYAH